MHIAKKKKHKIFIEYNEIINYIQSHSRVLRIKRNERKKDILTDCIEDF